MKKLTLAALLLITALCALTACSTLDWPFANSRTISIQADTDANQNSATAIDIVLVYDQAALSQLPQTGPEWFTKKAALTAGLGDAMKVVSLQIPPAKLIDDVPLPKHAKKAVAVYCYTNYLSIGGQAMGDLTNFKKVRIKLQEQTVGYEAY
ncbi:hypothetical protein [Parvibium lacunae]|uniref:Type VI secretion system lipoprotein TssJ n=1 Tax=Parvibium lacunae TaxID=1888893 RepID=A0A368L7I9_9BURK|nr:hypothetical protein [Parvibium lacunae]RCS59522.1 hypothetical protein DU000_02000 [Parvibium lacunae]